MNGLLSKNVAVLVLSHLRPEDEGVYKCRADFKKSPTKNNRTYLSVLCEYFFYKFPELFAIFSSMHFTLNGLHFLREFRQIIAK